MEKQGGEAASVPRAMAQGNYEYPSSFGDVFYETRELACQAIRALARMVKDGIR